VQPMQLVVITLRFQVVGATMLVAYLTNPRYFTIAMYFPSVSACITYKTPLSIYANRPILKHWLIMYSLHFYRLITPLKSCKLYFLPIGSKYFRYTLCQKTVGTRDIDTLYYPLHIFHSAIGVCTHYSRRTQLYAFACI